MASSPVSENLVVVRDGLPLLALDVQPPQDSEAIAAALLTLRDHARLCLGADLPWYDRKETAAGAPRLTLRLDVLAQDLAREGFVMTVDERGCELWARTPAGMGHAVRHFLEAAFGVRWLWPGESGLVAPTAGTVALRYGREQHAPDWHWRRLFLGGAFWEDEDPYLAEQKHGGLSPSAMRDWRDWQQHQRMEGLTIADGHRWCQICPPDVYGETHPEYFALVDGKRDTVFLDGKHGNQACTSNQAVIALTADYVIATFRARPELDGFSIAMNDGRGLCQCDDCRAIDTWAGERELRDDAFSQTTEETPGVQAASMRGTPVLTDRMLLFANKVAERVAEVYPDKLLMTLIYGQYRAAPLRVKLHRNVIAQFCSMVWQHVDEDFAARELGILGELAGCANQIGIYDYFINGRNGSLPRGFARVASRALKQYHDTGCRYYASQAGTDFATNGFAYYLAARALWDADVDPDAVLDDYCRQGFGDASAAVQRYIRAFLDRWEELGPDVVVHAPKMEPMALRLYPLDWRQARRDELTQAHAQTDSEAVRRRIAFLAGGLDFLDLLVDACAAALDERPDAGTRLDALLSWVDDHRDGFTCSAMWFDYQRLKRGGRLR